MNYLLLWKWTTASKWNVNFCCISNSDGICDKQFVVHNGRINILKLKYFVKGQSYMFDYHLSCSDLWLLILYELALFVAKKWKSKGIKWTHL